MIKEINKSDLIFDHFRNESFESLPSEILFLIFDAAIDSAEENIPTKNIGMVKFLQTSKSNYENQALWKRLCQIEGPDLLDIYPNLKTLADKNINWRAIALDVCSNEKRITTTNQRQFKLLDTNTNRLFLVTIDCNKLTGTKIKKLVIEEFRPTYKTEELGLVTDKDDMGFDRINIVKEKVFGTEGNKQYITQEKIGVVIPADDLRVPYYGYEKKEKEVPAEWLICNKAEEDKPEELFFEEESSSEQQHYALKCTIL